MEKVRESDSAYLIRKLFILGIVLCFVFSCAAIKPKQTPEQKPTPPIEEKVVMPPKEGHPPPQPDPGPPVKPDSPSTTPTISESPKVTPPAQPLPSPTPSLRKTKIVWNAVNLREGPGINYRVIGNVKKGTVLFILEDKGNWLRVRLEDGKEAWVSKAATSDAPKSPRPATSPKPKPM